MNKRCIAAALFAVLELPTLEIIAVTQEPIFCPSVMYIAAAVFTTPLNASVCKIPTDADELCIRAVTTIPTMIPSIGLPPSTLNASENIGAPVKGFILPAIRSSPKNSIPSPRTISPMVFFLSDFENSINIAPIPIIKGA